MAGWEAQLEANKRVDVTLMPPPGNEGTRPVFLELKPITPDWWSNWYQVYHDLGIHPTASARQNRPAASYAVCFLVNVTSPGVVKRHKAAAERHRRMLERVPVEPGDFTPHEKIELPLRLVHSSAVTSLCWPTPIHGRYPEGYRANARILWVTAACPGVFVPKSL